MDPIEILTMGSNAAQILVVENESIVAMDLQISLRDMGYHVPHTAPNAAKAIEAVTADLPDLALVDVSIDGRTDGIETAEILRSRFDVPVVFLTSKADAKTLERAKKTEPYGYLVKPCGEDSLRSAVEIALYKHQMERARAASAEKAKRDIEELSHLATRDALTGLLNRRAMNAALELEVMRSKRDRRPFAVAVLDLDHFKRINDTLGHSGGDEALRQVAELVRTSVRTDDYACRFGGEELVLILPNCTADHARIRALAILEKVRELRIRHQGREVRVTTSAGVASFGEHGESHESVFAAADAALYRAKSNGRDRVEVAE